MKKITSLLSLLLLYVGGVFAQVSLSQAGLEAGKVYAISNARGAWLGAPGWFKAVTGTAVNSADGNQHFAFVTSPTEPSHVYLYNVGQRKFVNKNKTLSNKPLDRIYIFETGEAAYPLFFSFTENKSNYNVNVSNGNMLVDSWNTYDAGNKNIATEVADADYDLSVVQGQFAQGAGGSITDLSQVNTSMAYTISTAARGSWFVNATADYVNSTGKSGVAIDAAADTWRFAFIPSPTETGVYFLYSLSAQKFLIVKGNHVGLAEYPDATSAVTFQPSVGSTQCPVVVTLNGTRQIGISNGFNPGVISHYNDLEDAGNQAAVEPVLAYTFDNSAAVAKVSRRYFALVESDIKPFYTTAGQGYFYLTEAARTALETAGYDANATNYTREQYEAMKAIVTNTANLRLPTSGWYRIKSSGSRNQTVSYIAAGGNYHNRGTDGFALKTVTDINDLSTYINFTKVEGTALPTYKLNCQGKGVTIPANSAYNYPFELTAEADAGSQYEFAVLPKHPGYVTILDKTLGGTQGLLHEAGWGLNQNAVVRWESDGSLNASAWQVEAVTDVAVDLHAVTSDTYATLFLPYGVTLNGNVKAYRAVFNADETALRLEEVGVEVPANLPVVLKGTDQTINLALNVDAAAGETTTALTGVLKPLAWTSPNLTLGQSNGVAGFYQWNGTKLGANRAYIARTSANGVKGLPFLTDDATSVSIVEATAEQPQTIYNLAGQRVNKAQKGVYIVNGKKTLY